MTGTPPPSDATTTRPVPRATDADATTEVAAERTPRRGSASTRAPAPLRRVVDGFAMFGRGVRNLVVEARSGQRPLVVVLLIAIALSVVMLSGPFERYLASRERVEALRAADEALGTENAALRAERDALEDPEAVEAIAREQQGMVRPGEVPYTVVPPEVDRPQITTPRSTADAPEPAWYERAWNRVRGWF